MCVGSADTSKNLAAESVSVGSVDDARAGQMKPLQPSTGGTSGSCEASSSMVTEPSSEDGDSRLSEEGARSSEAPGTSGQIVEEVADEGVRGKEGREKGGEEEVWLKFNDVSVHEIKWEEVMRESYGGDQNTSAYCLLYISPQLHQSWAKNGEQLSPTSTPLLSLYIRIYTVIGYNSVYSPGYNNGYCWKFIFQFSF